ncbi:glutamate--tRNA ligase [Candidatus Dojkabacteria bacterium]|nr:glutamate--tRNA ligase [Candidatus Dojkabacteria bacterium]
MDKKTSMESRGVRVRAAPSPTGRVHTGNLRTFLNNYLMARHNDGVNILRIEDTDRKRYVEGGTEAIIETLKLYGITFNEGPVQGGEYGPYVQSQRLDIYQKHANELVEKGAAYYCFCPEERLEKLRQSQIENHQKPMYDRHCRDLSADDVKKKIEAGEKYVVRMKFPLSDSIVFEDVIYGKIRVNNKEIDDMILLKSDGFPTYHFGSVVDDHYMGITHVFRGREYLTQTTRDVFLYESLGWIPPKWVHTPHLLNPDGKGKLSKRKGAMPGVAYLRKGYLPEAVLNYLVLCGWAPKPEDAREDEFYTLEDMIKLFDVTRMKKSNAKFDQNKLDHFNGLHIRRLGIDVLAEKVVFWAKNYVLAEFIADKFDEHEAWEDELKDSITRLLPLWESDFDYFKKALNLVYERLVYLAELPGAIDFFYDDKLNYIKEDFDKFGEGDKVKILSGLWDKLKPVLEQGWQHETWENAVRGYADECGWKHGHMFMTLRVAITGRYQSPPLFECMEVLGIKKCEKFVNDAIEFLKN